MKLYPLILTLLIGLAACQSDPVLHQAKQPVLVEGLVKAPDGVSIRYVSRGSGDTALVFVHCWSCDGGYWKAQMDKFATEYQVVALDLAGHGQSDTFRKDYTVASFAGDVAKVIKGLDLKKVILVGHSMGGPVIIETAHMMPERIQGLVAVDSFNTGFQWPQQSQIPEMLAPFQTDFRNTVYKMSTGMFAPGTPATVVDRIANGQASANPEIGLNALNNVLIWMQTDYPAKRQQLQKPLIHINAAKTNKPDAAEKIITVEETGHFIPQEVPEKFNQALEQAIGMIKN